MSPRRRSHEFSRSLSTARTRWATCPRSHIGDTISKCSRASSTTPSCEAPTTSRRDSQGVSAVSAGTQDPKGRPGRSARGPHARPLGTSRCAHQKRMSDYSQIRPYPDPCEAMDSSSLPGASPAANEPVENEHPPQGLPETKTLAPICAPPYPDDSRRGDLKEQAPRAARDVLTTPFECFSGRSPLASRDEHLPVSRSKACLIPVVNSFPLRKRAACSGTSRRCNTSCACPSLASTRNMDEKSVTSISPCGSASEKTLCLSALAPSSPKIKSCYHACWTRVTGFSWNLALTTSYGASDTGLTTSVHVSRRYDMA